MRKKSCHKFDQNLPCDLRYLDDRNTVFSKYVSIYLELPRKQRHGS